MKEKIIYYLRRLIESKVTLAIRDGILISLYFLILGLIISFLIPPHQVFYKKILESLRAGLGAMAISASFVIAYKLAKYYNLNPMLSGFFSLSLLILTFPSISLTSNSIHELLTYLAQGGLFAAIILGISLVRGEKFLYEKIKLSSLSAVIISFLILAGLILILENSGIKVHKLIFQIFQPLLLAGDSLPWAFLILFCICFLQFMGVHGAGIIGSLVSPIYLVLLQNNIQAAYLGEKLPQIITPPFFHWCLFGGTGATLPLCFLLFFSKSKHLKKIGKISILPGLININETLTYGLPLIMNPILSIPFISAPLILALINYLALYFNFIERIYILIPFAVPVPVGAYIVTGGGVKAAILMLINFFIILLFYYPFFKIYEKKILKEEKNQLNKNLNKILQQ
ncbi:MAG: PTS sugar transporter subunit IIC [Armatimonadetes bacterium]|nr:PTS sugar transporter subunit IIC [Armatimonadota bacterium]